MLLFFMGRSSVPHSNPGMKERGKKQKEKGRTQKEVVKAGVSNERVEGRLDCMIVYCL